MTGNRSRNQYLSIIAFWYFRMRSSNEPTMVAAVAQSRGSKKKSSFGVADTPVNIKHPRDNSLIKSHQVLVKFYNFNVSELSYSQTRLFTHLSRNELEKIFDRAGFLICFVNAGNATTKPKVYVKKLKYVRGAIPFAPSGIRHCGFSILFVNQRLRTINTKNLWKNKNKTYILIFFIRTIL